MPSAVENESQLDKSSAKPAQAVVLDLFEPESAGGCAHGCVCEHCIGRASLLDQAACVMVGASVHASEKAARRRLGAQSLHWGVLFVGVLLSTPILLPTLSEPARDWVLESVLNSPANWKIWTLSLLASGLFGFGFVSRLGRNRVLGGCAMIRRLGPAAILGIAWSTLPSFAGVMLILNIEPIRMALVGNDSAGTHLAMGMAIYLVGFVVLAGLGFLPTISQAILAGYAFGFPLGLGLSLAGFGGASLVGYEFVGRIARSRVESELQRRPRALLLRDALLHASPWRALLIVTLFRASPSSPFALSNLLLASLGVPRWVFFFGTLIGMLPRTLAAVLIGQQFTGFTGHIDKPAWMIIAGVGALVMLVVVISKAAGSALRRVASHPVPPLGAASMS